jgi:ERCC4-type nuclease
MKPDASLTLRPSAELAQMRVIVDTREQRPWSFPPEYVSVRRGTLTAGDYSLDGDLWAIERKSLDDFIGTVGAQFDRFCRELYRMPEALPRVVIVEGNMQQIADKRYNAGVQPKYIMRRIAQLTMLGVTVLFCENETLAALMAYRLFRRRQAFLNGTSDNVESAE